MRENNSRRPAHSLLTLHEDATDPNVFLAAHPPEELPLPEAELLRVIGRALQAQRMPLPEAAPVPAVDLPLVSRIETILGKKLEAANDGVTTPQPPLADAGMDDVIDALAAEEFHIAADEDHAAHTVAAERSPALSRSPWPLVAVGALCALGATAGMLVPTEPAGFRAEGVLAVQDAGEHRPALVTAARDALVSPRTIATAVTALKLDHDSEFSGGTSDAFKVAVDLLSASGAAADPVSRAEASLAAAIHASADTRAGTVGFAITTASAAKSARIASYLVSAVSGPATTAHAGDAALKAATAQADAELAAFTQQNGEGNVQVATHLQQQVADANAGLQDAEPRVVTARQQADLLKTAKADDVLTGALAAQVISPSLEDRRGKYAAAKSELAQLSSSLGPRHPRLIAQQAEVDGLRDSISQELGRLSRDAADELKAAVAARRQLGDQRNALIAQSKDTGVDLARLADLRDKVAAAHQRLEDAITTGALPADSAHLAVLKAPQVVAVSAGRSPWLTSAVGALAGLAFGLAGLLRRRSEPDDEIEQPSPSMSAEPALEMPEDVFADMPADATPDEVEMLRAEIATMRDRLRSYAATA